MAAQMASIYVRYFLNNQRAIIGQEATNPPLTDGHVDNLLLRGEYGEFLTYHNWLHLRSSQVKRMIVHALAQFWRKYFEETSGWNDTESYEEFC